MRPKILQMTTPDDDRALISVVVPVYNSEATLRALVDRLLAASSQWGQRFEVVLVNDGSGDESWRQIVELQKNHEFVRGIDLLRNYGQHNALLCGIREARGETIVTIDDDLQNPPEEITSLLAMLNSGHDVVYGVPMVKEHGLARGFASSVTKWLFQHAMGVRLAGTVSAFRVFRTRLRDAFATVEGPFVNIDVLLSWGTQRFGSVQVRQDPRTQGASNYPLRGLARHAIVMLTGFSTLPLQLATLLGLAVSAFGVLVLLYVVGRYMLLGYSAPGFPFLASALAIFSGAQLVALGVIGEYIASIHFRSMRKPAYGVRDRTGPKPSLPI
jgi:glycosyltransferase involved in cell wall biosynthesis